LAPFDSLFQSLRFRLSFWNSLVLILLVGFTLLGLFIGTGYALEREIDLLLVEDAAEMVMLVDRFRPNWDMIGEEMKRKAASHGERDWFGQIIGPDGKVLVRTQETPDHFPQVPLLVKGPISFEGRRVVELKTASAPEGSYHICVGSSDDFIREDMTRLSRYMLFAFLIILVVAPATGYWLAGRATRPLGNIIETASKIQPGQLKQRLSLSGSGDELDKLCTVINKLLDRLAKHLENQREFLANAAHELRSPLAALRSGVEVTLDRERSAEEYRQTLEETAEQCALLGNLVNQLLLLAETDEGAFQRAQMATRIDLLVRKVCEMFEGVAEQKGIRLQWDTEPAQVKGAPGHLRPIITNLIDNSLKFSRSGDSVQVRVWVPQDSPQTVKIVVSDTGEGIAPEHLPRLFHRFYRGDQARTQDEKKGGTGLGLSICQALIEAHGGSITVKSQIHQGTEFTVILPRIEETTRDPVLTDV